MPDQFVGDNPYVLILMLDGEPALLIDLDEPGWSTKHIDLMRAPGQWVLARKIHSEPVLTMVVLAGEQPYYTARVIGFDLFGARREIRAYGIGKKRLDGHVDRLWILPNGLICGGDDVNILGDRMARLEKERDHAETAPTAIPQPIHPV